MRQNIAEDGMKAETGAEEMRIREDCTDVPTLEAFEQRHAG